MRDVCAIYASRTAGADGLARRMISRLKRKAAGCLNCAYVWSVRTDQVGSWGGGSNGAHIRTFHRRALGREQRPVLPAERRRDPKRSVCLFLLLPSLSASLCPPLLSIQVSDLNHDLHLNSTPAYFLCLPGPLPTPPLLALPLTEAAPATTVIETVILPPQLILLAILRGPMTVRETATEIG